LNCAAILGESECLHEADMKQIDLVLNVNLRAQIVFCRAEVKAMLSNVDARVKGVIVNCVSVLAFITAMGTSASYITAKHAMVGLTKSMASAYGDRGIRTNAVAPGFIDTPMNKDFDDQAIAYFVGRTPIGRIAQPEEIASVIAFLCSPAASYMNGAILPVDGGVLAR